MSTPTPTAAILSIGTSVPVHKIIQDNYYSILKSANDISREKRLALHTIYRNSGIESRYSVLEEFKSDEPENLLFHSTDEYPMATTSQRMALYQSHAATLCEEAINDAFSSNPHLTISDVTHLITFSCTGMSAPGLDIQLIEHFQLSKNIERTAINFMGCHAGINALKLANHIIRSQPTAIVLLAGVELCTLHYQKNEIADQLISNAIFSDGAAACILASDSQAGNSRHLLLEHFYSEYEPSGIKAMAWEIGDFGFNLALSSYVPQLIEKNIQTLVAKLCEKACTRVEDISYYALHPGGRKILEACEKAFNISKSQNQISYEILRDYGNMSSVTLFFVLKKYLKKLTESDKNKKLLACAFGPGLTIESIMTRIN